MKKQLLTTVIAMALTGGFIASAQTDGNRLCQTPACDKAENKCCKNNGNRMKAFNPFEGIQLTSEQQAKIDKLKKPSRDKNVKQAPEMRVNREKARKDYINSVKEVLTPEQYTVFLENMTINRPDGKTRRHHRDANRHCTGAKTCGNTQAGNTSAQ